MRVTIEMHDPSGVRRIPEGDLDEPVPPGNECYEVGPVKVVWDAAEGLLAIGYDEDVPMTMRQTPTSLVFHIGSED